MFILNLNFFIKEPSVQFTQQYLKELYTKYIHICTNKLFIYNGYKLMICFLRSSYKLQVQLYKLYKYFSNLKIYVSIKKYSLFFHSNTIHLMKKVIATPVKSKGINYIFYVLKLKTWYLCTLYNILYHSMFCSMLIIININFTTLSVFLSLVIKSVGSSTYHKKLLYYSAFFSYVKQVVISSIFYNNLDFLLIFFKMVRDQVDQQQFE